MAKGRSQIERGTVNRSKMRQSFQFEVLKEPKGFVKLIQVFVAIFAFATCTGFRGRIELEQNCNKTSIKAGADFKYPFQSPLNFMIRECKNGAPAGNVRSNSVPFDYRSSTEYFVVIGVFCFLYSFGILVYYIMFEPDQSTSSVPPSKFSPSVIDFVISVVFVLFWFTSAIALAAAVTGIRSTTNIKTIISNLKDCGNRCTPTTAGNYATLDISAILGFLNVFVWCGNLWFLYKETPWHSPRNGSAATVSGPGGQMPTQVAPPAAAI